MDIVDPASGRPALTAATPISGPLIGVITLLPLLLVPVLVAFDASGDSVGNACGTVMPSESYRVTMLCG
ncbi:hypothetical protein [Glaciibacter psychrotolerans]|uniref:Uncharacterized protein n=1 Tax=Glaciibacter psychrotolerans TaxID=670054 RepID=A0A7Z0EDJ4_9MICO|nr:hypothetical protein [Leifsonia psychrotolerans]NYJ19674.1 hypothetical protein [Leifsonia psychrotolerans]